MLWEIFMILGMPLVLALTAVMLRSVRDIGRVNAAGHMIAGGFSALLAWQAGVLNQRFTRWDFFHVDALSAFFLLTIAVVNIAAAVYSIGYIGHELQTGVLSARKARVYYALFNIFCASMLLVPVVNNLGIMWVAIEMTTLISAFLVGFDNTKQSVEAAWKYIIICSAGIVLALLGTVLFSYAVSLYVGMRSLNWTDMLSVAQHLDKNVVTMAFLFILVGYGTKAGLAPMHTWLPDAHSQAVAPISALLSGVLLKTALYAILRFGIILNAALGSSAVFNKLLVGFGLFSLLLSAVLLLVQKDLKRLLAYSSIEHIGIITIGFGLGTGMAMTGALLHIFNHALTKALMFFGAGNIVSRYHRHRMNTIRGVLGVMPFTGVMVLIGLFAITGFPPFAMFVSELLIILAAFAKGSYVIGGLLLFAIAFVFGAMIFHVGHMLFGHIPKDVPAVAEPLASKVAMTCLLLAILGMGVAVPWFLRQMIASAILVLRGVTI